MSDRLWGMWVCVCVCVNPVHLFYYTKFSKVAVTIWVVRMLFSQCWLWVHDQKINLLQPSGLSLSFCLLHTLIEWLSKHLVFSFRGYWAITNHKVSRPTNRKEVFQRAVKTVSSLWWRLRAERIYTRLPRSLNNDCLLFLIDQTSSQSRWPNQLHTGLGRFHIQSDTSRNLEKCFSLSLPHAEHIHGKVTVCCTLVERIYHSSLYNICVCIWERRLHTPENKV